MSVDDTWDALLAETGHFPNALEPPALHGCLTAWAINFENMDDVPWVEEALGLAPAAPLPGKLRGLFEEYLDELSEAVGTFEFRLPDFDSGPDRHWAESWCRGFCHAVAADEETWETYGDQHSAVAKFLLMINWLGNPKAFTEALEKLGQELPEKNPENIEEIARGIASDVNLVGNLILGDSGILDEGWDEDVQLPEFEPETMRDFSNDELMELLLTLGDRVPEPVIRECAARGDGIVPLLRAHISHYARHDTFVEEEWWGMLHCIHILGLVPGPAAAGGLIDALEVRNTDPEDDLWEWLSGYWPALFANKHEHARSELASIAGDRRRDWTLRADVMECLAADPGQRETHLDLIAAVAADETQDNSVRELAGNVLLDYPRERHRELLERLAEEQARRDSFGVCFDAAEVALAFRDPGSRQGDRFNDPWSFYRPENILERQRRWRREDREAMEYSAFAGPMSAPPVETYVRAAPKIGRNDPCPCGSGRKYKKCCLNN